jgi:5-methyltetrahydropteroyltriglutamate--homocysteine methyltransferase
MARTAVLGFPRIGPERELKFALEAHWAGRTSRDALDAAGRRIRADHARLARNAGIDVIPVGDFAYYDHVLDTAAMAGIVADRHRGDGLAAQFRAARGAPGVRPLELTKWFDTNYHYLVPELEPARPFHLDAEKWIAYLDEATALGVAARPVVLGPFSLLLLAKGAGDPLALLPALADVYAALLEELAAAGAREVQLDEPCLVLDRSETELDAFAAAYSRLLARSAPEVCVATYFAALPDPALRRVAALGPAELHLDLVRAPEQLGAALAALPARTRLSAGVVDGRNVWATDVDRALDLLDRAATAIGTERLTIAPSCSLLHVPYSAAREHGIDADVRDWLAFGEEKLDELALLRDALDAERGQRDELLADARARIASRVASSRTHDPLVRRRVAEIEADATSRCAPLAEREALQRARLQLPQLPTTTIGSFPQTPEIRDARRRHREGTLDDADYERFLEREIAHVIREQEQLGLDVLVHGEPERNDMVEYFGERLAGFAISQHGWVQSYGSRCVKPPILYGDVARPEPMTVTWWQRAQRQTDRPVKGMLTGPVTILQWSFARDDQPRRETCAQIALAIADEVSDLERAGAAIIQVDEPALREGLPLRRSEREAYLRWAVDCFRLATAIARPETQIHTHMCYSEFGAMAEHIARLDADVISIEASRSGMQLLDAFRDIGYPGQIGPGVYDIHSPRVPEVGELEELLGRAEACFGRGRLWVNPDCGLKTRGWEETRAALRNLVTATERRRAAIGAGA